MDTETQIRRSSIGGSCALRIMDGDWHSLWLEKMGYKESEDLSDVLPVQLGIWTEPFNVKLFSKDMQVEVVEQQRYHAKWDGIPIRGTLDGEFTMRGERFGLECKHTNERATMNSQLQKYMPQLQLYMYVAHLNAIYFANIFGNSRYEYVKVAKDNDYLERLHTHLREFWGHVEREEEPPMSMPHFTASIDQIEINDMVARDASTDNHFVDRAMEYIDTKDAAKRNAEAAKDLKAMVGTNEREVYTDLLNVKRDKRGSLRINVLK